MPLYITVYPNGTPEIDSRQCTYLLNLGRKSLRPDPLIDIRLRYLGDNPSSFVCLGHFAGILFLLFSRKRFEER